MRWLSLLTLLALGSANAQPQLELTDPLLLVDGQRTETVGAPLVTSEFSLLELEIPGWGLVLISPTPFDGARRAGDFDGTRLVLVVDGRSIRLRSRTPLLQADGPIPAFARLDANPLTPSGGPVYLNLRRPQQALSGVLRSDRTPPPNGADELARQLEKLRVERDQLRQALLLIQQERDDALARLAALRDEVERLRLEVSGRRQPVEQLRAERDALRDEVRRLRASLDAVGTPPARRAPAPSLDTPTRLSLPGFDLTRLRNQAQIEARLRSTPYPEWAEFNGMGGDVLVLFQADETGAVIRTAVPRPVGGGLDALAEEIVRSMQFIPVRSDGQPTRLRSQVVMRFMP
ncbi:MAG: energy transducer TonB [Bacteroidota bacterium]